MIGSLINFQNVFTEAIITFIVILIIFFALGRLIQNKTKLFQNSYLISPFIGFLVYLAITAIAFIPFLFFGTTGDVLW
ncbi:MAG: hypothetical protein DRP42_02430 [Tenericutes bacterium]|nr:MAG: hypothetical protein DRP42_02430 [Mycoplasmatota bacterium]